MPLSLRDRLRGLKWKPSTNNSPETVRQNTAVAVAKDEGQIARDDLSTTPLPPSSSFTAGTGTSRRPAPLRSLLERYKARSATALSLPTFRPPSANIQAERDAGKTSAFAENFDDDDNDSVSLVGQSPPQPGKNLPKIQRVQGMDFEMISPHSAPDALKKSKSENCLPSSASQPHTKASSSHGPVTGSQARRQERTDSHQDAITAVDDVKTSSLAPPALDMQKFKDAVTEPTPNATFARRNQEFTFFSPTELIRPSTATHSGAISPYTPTGNPPFSSEAETTARDVISSLPPFAQVPSIPNPRTRIPKPLKPILRNARGKSSQTPTHHRNNTSIIVRPPVYDPDLPADQQWESDLGSTSRPAQAWEWMKRWTCCRCSALTIVEQPICARIECGHERCGSACRVVYRGSGCSLSSPTWSRRKEATQEYNE